MKSHDSVQISFSHQLAPACALIITEEHQGAPLLLAGPALVKERFGSIWDENAETAASAKKCQRRSQGPYLFHQLAAIQTLHFHLAILKPPQQLFTQNKTQKHTFFNLKHQPVTQYQGVFGSHRCFFAFPGLKKLPWEPVTKPTQLDGTGIIVKSSTKATARPGPSGGFFPHKNGGAPGINKDTTYCMYTLILKASGMDVYSRLPGVVVRSANLPLVSFASLLRI